MKTILFTIVKKKGHRRIPEQQRESNRSDGDFDKFVGVILNKSLTQIRQSPFTATSLDRRDIIKSLRRGGDVYHHTLNLCRCARATCVHPSSRRAICAYEPACIVKKGIALSLIVLLMCVDIVCQSSVSRIKNCYINTKYDCMTMFQPSMNSLAATRLAPCHSNLLATLGVTSNHRRPAQPDPTFHI